MADEELEVSVGPASSKSKLYAKLEKISTDVNPKARPGTIISKKLKHPFETGGEEIHYVDFKLPGVRELRKHGATAQISVRDQSFKFDFEVIALYIEKLGGLGKGDADKIDMHDGDENDPSDFDACKEIILVFFPVL